jgi:hypothetical protein
MSTIACPSCAHVINVLGIGTTVQCPGCGKETAVPGDADEGTAPETVPPLQTPSPLDRATGADSLPTLALGEVPPSQATSIPQGYEIECEIGRGGMGVVYRARQVALGRDVALKMLLHAGHTEQEGFGRFRTEAESLARLKHPGIVAIHEIGELSGLPFFAMEWCEGGSLDRKLGGKPMPPKEAAALVQEIGRAVQAAHEAKVIHRDLKPANVLLAADGRPKVSDFGLAKKLDEQGRTQTGTVMGTPEYMPPEQAAGKKEIDARADVYSLGAILYECLTGRPPFRAATVVETLAQVLNEEPVAPRSLNAAVPRELETIALKCLAKEPPRRYATARELAEDLRRFLAGEPVLARPAGVAGRLWRWCRGNPLFAAALLAAPLIMVPLTGWLVSRRQTQSVQAEAVERSRTVLAMSEASHEYARETLSPAVRKAVNPHKVGLIFEADSSTFVARGTFDAFRKRQPQYSCREAALNPLNLANTADAHEEGLIRRFAADPDLHELSGFRKQDDGGERFYVARPIFVRGVCLQCHDTPERAPPELVERYGSDHGFGWREGEVAGAIIVTVPTDDLRAEQRGIVWTVAGTFSVLFLMLGADLAILLLVVRPKRRA